MKNLKKLLSPAHTWGQVLILVILTVFYVLAVQVFSINEKPVGATLISIPVAFAGWYFGTRAGLIAGFSSILLNAALFAWLRDTALSVWLVNGWPEILMAIVVGYTAGRIKKEMVERNRIGIKLNSLERYNTIFGLAVKDILDPKTLGEKYYYLATHLANLFGADGAAILRWNAGQEQMTLLAATGPAVKPELNIVLEADNLPQDAVYLRSSQALVIREDLKSANILDLASLSEFSLPAQSALGLPLIAGTYKFGVVMLSFDAPRRFAGEEIIVAQLTGSQMALALWTDEQDMQLKRRLLEANALASIERALSETERVGLETVLQLIIDSAKNLIPGAKQVILHLINAENQVLTPRAVAGLMDPMVTNLHMRLGDGVAGQVIATGNSISISDVRTDPRFKNQTIPVKYRSLSVAPIKSQAQVVGTISIESDLANAFTADDNRLLDALGIQAAIAIENANLLETTREDLQEMNALYQINRGLAATLEPTQLIKDVTHLLQQNFGFYYVQVFVLDSQSGNLVVRHASGANAAGLLEQHSYLAKGVGIIGYVAEHGEAFMTNNVDEVPFFVHNPYMPETQSELTVPIKIDNQVLGILDIQEKRPRLFTQRQMKLMMSVADQFAVALQKANLYEELQSSLRQEQATRAQLIQSERLAVAGRLLASVSHELNNPLQAIQNALYLIKAEEKLSEQGLQDLDIILSETERMTSLIGRLRTTYRATQVVDYKATKLNDVIEDIFALTSTHMRHKSITFQFQPDENLPEVQVIPDQIRQVTLNLFMNAIEAMDKGGCFTVCTQALPEQNQVLLTFSDTGPGINPQILPQIFEPFVTNKDTGTGLGLTITRDIIAQHRGEIRAENNAGAGATFKVWLPVTRKQ